LYPDNELRNLFLETELLVLLGDLFLEKLGFFASAISI